MGSRFIYFPGFLLALFSLTTCGGSSSSSSGSGTTITSTVAVPTTSSASVSSFLTKYASAIADVAPSDCTDCNCATSAGETLEVSYDSGTLTIDAASLEDGIHHVFLECSCDGTEVGNYFEAAVVAGTAVLGEPTDIDSLAAVAEILDALGGVSIGDAMDFGIVKPEEVYAYIQSMFDAEDGDDLGGDMFDMREMMRAYAAKGGKCDAKCMKDFLDGTAPPGFEIVDDVLGSGFSTKISGAGKSFNLLNEAMFSNCMGKLSGSDGDDFDGLMRVFMNYGTDEFTSTFTLGSTNFSDVFNIINSADAATKVEGYLDNLASIFMGYDSDDWAGVHMDGDYDKIFQLSNTDSIECDTQEECESKFADMWETFEENPNLFIGSDGGFDPTQIANVASTIDATHDAGKTYNPDSFKPSDFTGACTACVSSTAGTTTGGTTTGGTTTGGTTTGGTTTGGTTTGGTTTGGTTTGGTTTGGTTTGK